MDVMVIFKQMVILFGLIMVGYMITRKKIVTKEFGRAASDFIVKVASPALILSAAMGDTASFDTGEIFRIFVVAVVFYMVMPVVAWIPVKLLRIPQNERNLFRFMTVFSNVGFMGFPVIESIYGRTAVFYASIFNMVFNAFIYTLGVSFMTGSSDRKIPFRKMANPGTVASLTACVLVFTKWRVPGIVVDFCSMLGGITSPLVMIVIGISLSDLTFREVFREYRLYPFAFIKQLVLPVLLIPVLRLVITSEYILGIVVIIIAMPVAALSVILSYTYGQDTALAAKSVFITTLVTVFTIPLIAALL